MWTEDCKKKIIEFINPFTMRQLVKKILNNKLYSIKKSNYLNLYKRILDNNPALGLKSAREDEWLSKWRKYDKSLSPLSYRIFSRYIGLDMNIAPPELVYTIVEPILTPLQYLDYYSDKNSLDKILPSSYTPEVFVRNINGFFYDGSYNRIDDIITDNFINSIRVDKVIVKPTLSSGGKGVKIYSRVYDKFIDASGKILSLSHIRNEYKYNFLISECIEQSDITSKFNESSVNTIRIATYRDRKGVVHPLRALLRIGAKGADVDNIHAGGVRCGIHEDGTLNKYVCNLLGNKKTEFNGIDFTVGYKIPNYESVREFAADVSRHVLHHDLVSLDVVIDKHNMPRLLEINVGGFSGWAFQFTSGTMFGEYTDEIFEFCNNERNNLSLHFALNYNR